MSNDIDQRIVAMKFDNAQFEAGVKTTLSTLEGLKKGLNLNGAKKSLEGLDAAGKRFSLQSMAAGIENISSKFSALGVIGVTALSNIENKLIDFSLRMAGSLTSSITAGLGEYETKLNSVQTILANTQSKGTSLDQVNDTLKDLNTYSDQTIYNFGEMARNIGTFTAAGVGLKPAATAIKGIANLAALSGSSSMQASTAMYQLSQAISSGTVRLMDWNSVQNAGMGGEVFQTALINTARTQGVAVDAMIKKNGSFRDSLQEGWLSAEIMTKTLAQFTGDLSVEQIKNMGYTEAQAQKIYDLAQTASDAATKVKTFSQLMGTLAEATGSGWAESWQIVLGDFEEAKTLFTEINDIVGGMIGESAKARNAQLQIWKDLGGRKAIIDGLRNAFKAVMQIITPIGEAFRTVFPPSMGKTLAALSIGFRDFTQSLKIGKEGSANLKTVFLALFRTIKVGVDIFAGLASIVATGVSYMFKFAGVLVSFLGPVMRFFSAVLFGGEAIAESASGIEIFFAALRNLQTAVLEPIIQYLKSAAEGFDAFLNGGDLAAKFRAQLQPILDFFNMLKNALQFDLGGALASAGASIGQAWTNLGTIVQGVWTFIKGVASTITGIFAGMGPGFEAALKSINLETILNVINTGLFAGIILSITKLVKSGTGLSKGLTDALGGLTDALKSIGGVPPNPIAKIAAAILMLAAAVYVLSLVNPERLVASVTALGALFVQLLVAMAIFNKIAGTKGIAEMAVISAALILLGAALAILALAVRKLGGMKGEELARGLAATTVLLGLLLLSAKGFAAIKGDFAKTAGSLVVMAGALLMLSGVVAIFSLMSGDQLVQGFAGLTAMLVLFVGAAVLLSKGAGQMSAAAVGMLAMAVAIGLLTNVVVVFGLLPFPVLLQGMLALTAVVGLLVGAGILLSKFAPQMSLAAAGMVGMAFAVGLLVNSVVILGTLPMDVLIQGLVAVGIAMAMLAVAANFMTTALPGAIAMVAVAGAVLILAFAIQMLGSMDPMQIVTALLAMAATLAIFGIAAALLTPVIPSMVALAGAIALIGLAALAAGVGMFVFSLGVMLLGPALQLLGQGLLIFAQNLQGMGGAMLVLAGLGLALAVLGAGALIAGLGLVLLGAGLFLTAAGLMALGVASIMGVTGLASFVLGMERVMPMIPQFLALGAALLVLGAGMIVAGVGMLLVGVGALVLAAGLLALQAAAAGGTAAIGTIVTAFTDLWTQIPGMLAVGAALLALGAGALAAGAGVLLLGVAALVLGAGLLVLSSGATVGAAAIQILVDAFAKFGPVAGQAGAINGAIVSLSGSLALLALAAVAVGVGLAAAGIGLVAIGIGGVAAAAGVAAVAGVAIGLFPQVAAAITSGVTSVSKGVDETLRILKGFSASVSAEMPKVVTAGTKAMSSFNKAMVDEINRGKGASREAAKSVGAAITDGMVAGLNGGSSKVETAARGVAQKALAAAKSELGVASPSKEFEKVGKWSDEGLATGLSKFAGLVEIEAAGVGHSAISSLKDALANVGQVVATEMDATPTIRPVLDLSAIKRDSSLISGMLGKQALPIDSAYLTASSILASQRSNQVEDATAQVSAGSPTNYIHYEQHNTSPEALSAVEIYRQTKNQLSTLKGAMST